MSNSSKLDETIYIDLDGRSWNLADLDTDERKLFEDFRRAADKLDWNEFDNYRLKTITALYEARGLSRRQISQKPLFDIGQDLSSRIAVTKGYALYGDYRDDLEEIAKTRFNSHRAFCKATGLSEDMLSHVLAGRKDLSIRTLSQALAKIGYELRAVPAETSPIAPKARKARAS